MYERVGILMVKILYITPLICPLFHIYVLNILILCNGDISIDESVGIVMVSCV